MSFQKKTQSSRKRRALFRAYVWQRQTLHDLAEKTRQSIRTLRRNLDTVLFLPRVLSPKKTPLVADMTFWGRGYGVIVFRSPILKENLWWKESSSETACVYEEGAKELQKTGWIITGVVIDGKQGVARVFERFGIPVQYCQFHQIKTVTRYLTRNPKTNPARELRAITLTLSRTTEKEFRFSLAAWYERHLLFLNEKSPTPQRKRKWEYMHRRIRSAYRSLTTNLTRLFTYQKYPELELPNTTNCLDGMFSQLKNRLAVHRGLRRDRRYKIISEILSGRKHSN